MSSKPKLKKKPTSGKTTAVSTEQTMDELFEQAFAVIDSAFTAALISGVNPNCLLASLSYGFLNVAARARSRSTEFEPWLKDPNLVWEPALSEVLTFVKDFDGPVEGESELLELEYLRDECKIKNFKLSELEERQHNKTAFSLLSWLLTAMQNQGHQNLFIECALFVQWVKVSAIVKDCGDRNYLIVRHNVPDVAGCWDQLI